MGAEEVEMKEKTRNSGHLRLRAQRDMDRCLAAWESVEPLSEEDEVLVPSVAECLHLPLSST
jgi:hypothetical protein